MSDPEDVYEYVDETIESFQVERLLKWLLRIGGGQAQKIGVRTVLIARGRV